MSKVNLSLLVMVLFSCLGTTEVDARLWRDKTGAYSIEADLIGFDETTVIIQRANKELGSCEITRLSDADREFLKSKEASEIHDSNLEKTQSWKLLSGLQLIGKVVDYAKRDVTLQRRRGNLYVNNSLFANLPAVYQKMLMAVLQEEEGVSIGNIGELNKWVLSLRGEPREYHLEGVVMEFENGDEYSIPFTMFVKRDRDLLAGGFDEWLEYHDDEIKEDEVPSFTDPNEHQIRLQSLAATYHRDQQVNQQIALMNLQLQQVQAGLTSAWEVTLYPVRGNTLPPRWVVVYARDSLIATNVAIQKNPGFVAGPIRRLN
ncbi:SHD1 domain-containing protein [Rubripirellula sp.]|nr:SHD1 domain-containing protein [Rubripirellula sp.]MDB4338794.1 SHD1 domain-containing protein [Rubripirellula sp.]